MNSPRKKTIAKKNKGMGFMLKFLVVFCFAVLFFVTFKLFEQTYKQNQINGEISRMQQEISALNQDNHDLEELINYLQTDDFKEKEAKDKLNLIKEGESLVLIKEKDVLETNNESSGKNNPVVVISRPKYYYWWHLFFSN